MSGSMDTLAVVITPAIAGLASLTALLWTVLRANRRRPLTHGTR